MWNYPEIDPVAVSIGPLSIHWYALTYLVGIGLAWWACKYRVRRYGHDYSDEQVSDLIFYATIGILLGGRVGYMFFYGMGNLLKDPLSIFRLWDGGMSFHGGMLGVLLAMYVYARRFNRTFFQVTDFIAPLVPLGLGSGRIGNFINGELPGRIAEVPWAVIYPGDHVGRHPSSLYQALLEGPVLLLLLWLFASRPRPTMAVSGVFCIGYGCLRTFSEFFREPDAHLRFVAFDFLTMGQLLSIPLVLFGATILVLAMRRKTPVPA